MAHRHRTPAAAVAGSEGQGHRSPSASCSSATGRPCPHARAVRQAAGHGRAWSRGQADTASAPVVRSAVPLVDEPAHRQYVSIAMYAVFAQLMLQTAGALAVPPRVWSGLAPEFWRPPSRSASSPTAPPAVAREVHADAGGAAPGLCCRLRSTSARAAGRVSSGTGVPGAVPPVPSGTQSAPAGSPPLAELLRGPVDRARRGRRRGRWHRPIPAVPEQRRSERSHAVPPVATALVCAGRSAGLSSLGRCPATPMVPASWGRGGEAAGQDDDAHVGMGVKLLASRSQAVHPGHLQVHEDHVRPGPDGGGHLAAVCTLAHHPDVLFTATADSPDRRGAQRPHQAPGLTDVAAPAR
jgi:hypothetical protein